MDAWNLWTWPWTATLEAWRRSLDPTPGQRPGASGDDGDATRLSPPAWTTPNRLLLDLPALRLRDFSTSAAGVPLLVVAPFALHDAHLADLAPGHSLVETLLGNGCARLYLVEWKSATAAMRLNTIDTQLASLNVAIDDIVVPVDIVGLCQGGWLSLVYAARFPGKVRRLALVGAPFDIEAEASALTAPINAMSEALVDELVRRGRGRVLGRDMVALWPHEFDAQKRLVDSLQLTTPIASDAARRAVAAFTEWDHRILDLPGPYYREVFFWLYRENRLATGRFPALGKTVDPRALRRPLFLLAGAQDAIAPPAQVFAAASLVGAGATDVETALAPCNHLALFMGRETLQNEWPRLAQWLRK